MRSAHRSEGFVLLDALLLVLLCSLLASLALVLSQTMKGMEGWIVEDARRIAGAHDGRADRTGGSDDVQRAACSAFSMGSSDDRCTALSHPGSDGCLTVAAVPGTV
ncbi:MAG: hypothetical protein ACLVJ6_09400 [Merdibacter sp.]